MTSHPVPLGPKWPLFSRPRLAGFGVIAEVVVSNGYLPVRSPSAGSNASTSRLTGRHEGFSNVRGPGGTALSAHLRLARTKRIEVDLRLRQGHRIRPACHHREAQLRDVVLPAASRADRERAGRLEQREVPAARARNGRLIAGSEILLGPTIQPLPPRLRHATSSEVAKTLGEPALTCSRRTSNRRSPGRSLHR